MIKDEELYLIKGGGINYGILGAVVAAITFIVGIIDGYQRPIACDD